MALETSAQLHSGRVYKAQGVWLTGSVHLQALINILDMPMAPDELTSAAVSVLYEVALGSVDGCVFMLQGGIEIAATALLTDQGLHDDRQDALLAALTQQICQKVPQAQVC